MTRLKNNFSQSLPFFCLESMHKKHLETVTLILCILLCSLSWQVQAQTYFEGFENWTDTLNTHIPNGWTANYITTNNFQTDSTFFNVSRVAALTEGEYALQISNGYTPSLEGYGDNAISIPFEKPGDVVNISFTAKCEGEGYCEFRLGPAYWQVEAGSNETYLVELENIFISDAFSSLKILFISSPNDTGYSTPGISFFTIDDLQISPWVVPSGCNTVDPLSMPWFEDLFENIQDYGDECSIKNIFQFEDSGFAFFKVSLDECGTKYFDCQGRLFCSTGENPEPRECTLTIQQAGENGTQIYEPACLEPIEYEITTPPVCVGENFFSVGITIASEGNYTLGENYSGELVTANVKSETILILRSDQAPYIINPTNNDTGCSTADLLIDTPNCQNTQNSCAIDDPVNNLPWLQDVIDELPDHDCENTDYISAEIYYICHLDLGLFVVGQTSNFADAPLNYLFDAVGNLICEFGGFGPDNCPKDWLIAFDVNRHLIWPCVNVCDLPLDTGSPDCTAVISRYYYSAEAQDCLEFGYTGCGGNANNYQAYEVCIQACGNVNPCTIDDPLNLPWLSEIINNSDGCEVGSIEQFSYDDSEYIKVNPYYTDPYYYCPTDLPIKVYTCGGDLFCTIGGYGQQFKQSQNTNVECESELTDAAFNGTLLWTYDDTCTEPIEYEITTSPVCVGENLFAIGITITNEGNYTLGENYSGELISENFELETILILRSDQASYIINPTNHDTGCSTEDILIEAPNCENAENSCTIDDPINNLPWLQDIIDEFPDYDCEAIDFFPNYEIFYTCHLGLGLFLLNPTSGISDASSFLYDAVGNLICEYGAFGINSCPTDWIDAYDENGKVIWPCVASCEDPLQLEVVQNAINEDCAELIFTFIYEDQQYIFINKTCEGNGVIYNCETQTSCTYNSDSTLLENCNLNIKDIEDFYENGNIIWSKPCNYEYEGIVDQFFYPCGEPGGTIACDAIIQFIELDDGTIIYPLQQDFIDDFDNQRVRFTYTELADLNFDLTFSLEPASPIICIEEIIENNCEDPLQLELVQNAIEDECVAAIYGFDYLNQAYVLIDNICEEEVVFDTLYNCANKQICEVSDGYSISEDCETLYNEVKELVNEDNLLWTSTPCTYEHSGIVKEIEDCGFIIELEDGVTIQPIYSTFEYTDGQQVELSFYYPYYDVGCDDLNIFIAKIICIREIETNPILFENFNWLNNLINTQNCTGGTTITAYNYPGGNFTFLHIIEPNGEGNLYFQDGTLYCSDGQAYSCLEGYNLTQSIDSWTCNNPIMPSAENELFDKYSWLNINPANCATVDKITEYDLGSYSFVFVEDSEGGKLYFEDGTFYCASGLNYNCVELYGLGNSTDSWACENPSEKCVIDDPFNLDWIQEIIAIDPEFGVPGIIRYENAYYPGLINEIAQFQFQGDSYFYANFSVEGPLIDAVGSVIFDCTGKVICYDTYLGLVNEPICQFAPNSGYGEELIWVNTPNDIFTVYPWLSTLVDPNNCNNSSVQVYAYDSFEFISIETSDGKNLYFQDGTFYCSDGLNYSCVELYDLSNPINNWQCGGAIQKQATNLSQQKIEFDFNFKIYPNPSKGQFVVEFNHNNHKTNQLKIRSMEGKIIQSIEIESDQKQVAIDLTGVTRGVYLIQLQSSNNIILRTQKIIIQ